MRTVTIRKFEEKDIQLKVKWINDPENNQYLHYDLPLEIEKTKQWYEENKNRTDRFDAVIEVNGIAVGLIGLLSIDSKNAKAEYYITLGEHEIRGKGIAREASILLLKYGFQELGLNKIYLFTESQNLIAQRLFERVGFCKEGLMRFDLFSHGRYVDRFAYGITSQDWQDGNKHQDDNLTATAIDFLGEISGNRLYIKRDDLISYSFGGNKVRKAALYFRKIDTEDFDTVVTYGSSSSNHCRIVANMAAQRGLPCYIISPEDAQDTYNSRMMRLLGAIIENCTVDSVRDTINGIIEKLKSDGFKPFFIPGGGHGNTGTQAYVDCYEEIKKQEKQLGLSFDYIFHASGTGTTQAGLVCGCLLNNDKKNIVGISIARKNPRGRQIVLESVKEYMLQPWIAEMQKDNNMSDIIIDSAVTFVDEYIGEGYSSENKEIDDVIKHTFINYGIPLDGTYTGKAFSGMEKYLKNKEIKNQNVLFIHTGGTPLYFDFLTKRDA